MLLAVLPFGVLQAQQIEGVTADKSSLHTATTEEADAPRSDVAEIEDGGVDVAAEQIAVEHDAAIAALVSLDTEMEVEDISATADQITPNEARKLRGFTTDIPFVPRGQWIFGGTASYSLHTNDDFNILVINDVNSEGYTVSVAPIIAFAPWKNMAVGIRFAYGRTLLVIDNANLSFGEGDMGVNLSVDRYHKLKHSYTGTIFWRPYIPLGHSNRFAIYAEVQLNLSGSQGKNVMADGVIDGLQNYRGSYTTSFGASLALQPGIVAFVTNNTALELSIGVFGVGYERVDQVFNQIEEGSYESSNANFKVNLLSIGFGVSFYL